MCSEGIGDIQDWTVAVLEVCAHQEKGHLFGKGSHLKKTTKSLCIVKNVYSVLKCLTATCYHSYL